jgi:hypothetical protein
MKKRIAILGVIALTMSNLLYSQKLIKGDFKVTITYLENILNNGITKRQLDSVLPYNSSMGWDRREINAYNPATKDWSGKTSVKYGYSCSYRKENIKIEFIADNDSSSISYLTIVINGYFWLDKWLTSGNNIKSNGYKVDIYKLFLQELMALGYNAGESELVHLSTAGSTFGSNEYYHKSNFKVKLFYNLTIPAILTHHSGAS